MKTALVTGASRGIGRQIATALAQNGYAVAINYLHTENKAQALANALCAQGLTAKAFCADVSNFEQVTRMVTEITNTLGEIDLLVNNAGIANLGLLQDLSEDAWDRLFAVNVKSAYNCCKAILPYMIQNHSGNIINISSIWGICGASCEVAYSATKAAVIGFTKALAKEVGPSGIRVNCIAPGVIDTDMNQDIKPSDMQALRNETPLGRIGTVQDIAQTALFLADDRSSFITGQIISPNGGYVI